MCVDTLKRDWQPKLTLRDVLIVSVEKEGSLYASPTKLTLSPPQTISCLLIYPNPDSALNSSAGNLLRDDYEGFAHQAKLMTSIHAPIPPELMNAVQEAKSRGDDTGPVAREREEDTQCQRPLKQQRIHGSTPRKMARRLSPSVHSSQAPRVHADASQPMSEDEHMGDSENEDPASASKENNASLSPTPMQLAPSQRKNALGKRPLSVLAMPYPEDPDADMMLVDSDPETEAEISPSSNTSEQNIAANALRIRKSASPQRKPPKLPLRKGTKIPGRPRDDLQIYEDVPDRTRQDCSQGFSNGGKENRNSGLAVPDMKERHGLQPSKQSSGFNTPIPGNSNGIPPQPINSSSHPSSRVSKKPTGGARKSAAPKPKPRIGVRRL